MKTRAELLEAIAENRGTLVVKVGAAWCGPCKRIQEPWSAFADGAPDGVAAISVDCDQSPDLYAFLRGKRMVTGLPTIMAWQFPSHEIACTASLSGGDPEKVAEFLRRLGDNRA